MSGPEYALAMLLLIAPAGSPVPEVTADEWPALQTAIHFYGVEWEILDPREVKYVLTRLDDMQADLDLLRKRYQDLKEVPSRRPPRKKLTASESLKRTRDFDKRKEQFIASLRKGKN